MKVIIHDLPQEEFDKLGFSPEEYKIVDAGRKAAYCQGCFGCWLKTPGKCVYKDSLEYMGARLATSEELTVISRCTYGGYSAGVKRVFDRSIAVSQPLFTYRAWRTHHVPRYQNRPRFCVYFYGAASDYEKEIARELVQSNAVNLNCSSGKCVFIESAGQLKEVLA